MARTEVYLSSISNRTNEIMKVLTIITIILLLLTLIAGIHGRSFDPGASPWNMPELKSRWGYPFALGLMVLVALILILRTTIIPNTQKTAWNRPLSSILHFSTGPAAASDSRNATLSGPDFSAQFSHCF
jgi:hypothetical protein